MQQPKTTLIEERLNLARLTLESFDKTAETISNFLASLQEAIEVLNLESPNPTANFKTNYEAALTLLEGARTSTKRITLSVKKSHSIYSPIKREPLPEGTKAKPVNRDDYTNLIKELDASDTSNKILRESLRYYQQLSKDNQATTEALSKHVENKKAGLSNFEGLIYLRVLYLENTVMNIAKSARVMSQNLD